MQAGFPVRGGGAPIVGRDERKEAPLRDKIRDAIGDAAGGGYVVHSREGTPMEIAADQSRSAAARARKTVIDSQRELNDVQLEIWPALVNPEARALFDKNYQLLRGVALLLRQLPKHPEGSALHHAMVAAYAVAAKIGNGELSFDRESVAKWALQAADACAEALSDAAGIVMSAQLHLEGRLDMPSQASRPAEAGTMLHYAILVTNVAVHALACLSPVLPRCSDDYASACAAMQNMGTARDELLRPAAD